MSTSRQMSWRNVGVAAADSNGVVSTLETFMDSEDETIRSDATMALSDVAHCIDPSDRRKYSPNSSAYLMIDPT